MFLVFPRFSDKPVSDADPVGEPTLRVPPMPTAIVVSPESGLDVITRWPTGNPTGMDVSGGNPVIAVGLP